MLDSPSEVDSQIVYKSIRINVLLGIAYATILLCFVSVVAYSGMDDYAKSIITLILGRFLGYIDQVYSFEFGTTRSSKIKDEVISTLTSTTETPLK